MSNGEFVLYAIAMQIGWVLILMGYSAIADYAEEQTIKKLRRMGKLKDTE